MAKQVKLSARARAHIGGTVANKLKRDGLIPAIIYGGKENPLPLQVASREISTLLSHARGENILVELEIENAGARTSEGLLQASELYEPLQAWQRMGQPTIAINANFFDVRGQKGGSWRTTGCSSRFTPRATGSGKPRFRATGWSGTSTPPRFTG